MSERQRCCVCKRVIRSTNEKAQHLFNRPGDVEVWVCGPKCLHKYNEQD